MYVKFVSLQKKVHASSSGMAKPGDWGIQSTADVSMMLSLRSWVAIGRPRDGNVAEYYFVNTSGKYILNVMMALLMAAAMGR